MAKSGMSTGFAKFAAKTTKGSFDEARQNERLGSGIPFEVGQKGTGVVSAIICDQAKPDPKTGAQYPRVRVELSINTPESHRGKPLSGGGLMQNIKDSSKPGSSWTAESAWGAMLGMLENLGLPEEISKGYKDFQECLDWFEEEPREVIWEIVANDYTNNQGQLVHGKNIAAFARVQESNIPTAEDGGEEHDPDAKYCMFRNTKHRILDEEGDNVKIKSVNSGMERTVPTESVEMV